MKERAPRTAGASMAQRTYYVGFPVLCYAAEDFSDVGDFMDRDSGDVTEDFSDVSDSSAHLIRGSPSALIIPLRALSGPTTTPTGP